MTKAEAERMAAEMREDGWPDVHLQCTDDGQWHVIARNPNAKPNTRFLELIRLRSFELH